MIASLPLLAWPRQPLLTVLMYHRVLPEPDPFRPGEIAAEAFAAQAAFLARHFAVLPLLDAVRLLKAGRLPKRACCITFDDGYLDNLTVAAPILKQYDLPATVFVAAGYLDGESMFNDSVIDIIGHCEMARLDLQELGLGTHRMETLTERQQAIANVLREFRHRPPETRQSELLRLLGLAGRASLPDGLMLSREQVRQLADSGVEIGGHTVTHPVLTSVDDERARAEMADGKQQLEAIVGRAVRTFAYPNGKPVRDYLARHAAMAREVGFEAAVTIARGVAVPGCDEFQLPRLALWGDSRLRWAVQLVQNARMGEAAATC